MLYHELTAAAAPLAVRVTQRQPRDPKPAPSARRRAAQL